MQEAKKYYKYEDEYDCFIVEYQSEGNVDGQFKGIVVHVPKGNYLKVGDYAAYWEYSKFTECKSPFVSSQDQPEDAEVLDPSKFHPHRDLIIAWANGAEIEYYSESTYTWYSVKTPFWEHGCKYRIKPKEDNLSEEYLDDLLNRLEANWLREGYKPKEMQEAATVIRKLKEKVNA